MQIRHNRVLQALLGVQVCFGFNYIFSKKIVMVFSPFVWADIRILISTVVLVTIAILRRAPFPPMTKEFLKPLLFFALTGTVINQICFLLGLKYTTATNSAILNTLIPIFTLMLVILRGQEKATFRSIVGFISALFGVLWLRGVENFTFSDQTFIGDLLIMVNCLSFAIFLTSSKAFFEKYDRGWSTALIFAVGSIGISIISLPAWVGVEWPEMNLDLWFSVFYGIVGGTILPYVLNNFALAHARTSSVALFIYIQPMIAALAGWLFLSETITFRTIGASLLIFGGVLLGLNQREAVKHE